MGAQLLKWIKLLLWTLFIGQIVHRVGGNGMEKGVDGRYRYFSQLQVSLYEFMKIWCNIQVMIYPFLGNSWAAGGVKAGRGLFLKEQCPISTCALLTSRYTDRQIDRGLFQKEQCPLFTCALLIYSYIDRQMDREKDRQRIIPQGTMSYI